MVAPEEFVNPVTSEYYVCYSVYAAWVVAILGWHIRSTVTEENVEKAMSYFAIAWLLYGLHGVLSEKYANRGLKVLNHLPFQSQTIGGIVFLVLSVVYYMLA